MVNSRRKREIEQHNKARKMAKIIKKWNPNGYMDNWPKNKDKSGWEIYMEEKEEKNKSEESIQRGWPIEDEPLDRKEKIWKAVWNHVIKRSDKEWVELKEKSESVWFLKEGPSLETVLSQETYRQRWKTILHMQMIGKFDGNLMYDLKQDLPEGAKCWACKCKKHEATECLSVNFVVTCSPLREDKNIYTNENFYANDGTNK